MTQIHLSSLQTLQRELLNASTEEERHSCLERNAELHTLLARPIFARLSPVEKNIIKQLVAIGQAERLLASCEEHPEALQDLLQTLQEIDLFYRELGGLVGYQAEVLRLLHDRPSFAEALYHSPPFLDISEETPDVQQWIENGILALPRAAEIYPVGGAADRLHLVDDLSGVELPAAKLRFAGRTLLEGMIRDLQARESLYLQKTGKRCITPVALMTSAEKKNHQHILAICEEKNWFGRPKELFRLFMQPLVPTIDAQGNWITTAPLKLLLKPGGHGVIWKLARDQGIFLWFRSLGRDIALVRQINNPLAGLDYGLTAFLGIGAARKMHFGFASCPRLLRAAEGVNVLIERKRGDRSELLLSNIEYCEFDKRGIKDAPRVEGDAYSRYSSNTNLLFADLSAIENALETLPFPGLLLNLKKGAYRLDSGERHEEPLGRLEATMQNIADAFVEPQQPEKTFITYNHRHKTISTAKRAYIVNGPLAETPERCFYDLLQAARELLERHCRISLPPQRSEADYLAQGPECLFLYHPMLGPLYSTIQEKLHGGQFALGAELQLELSDVEIRNLDLDGSLSIVGDGGRAILHNVHVYNRGVDWSQSAPYWKGDFTRKESLSITLKGRSEFFAENVLFQGSHHFTVEDGTRLQISQDPTGKVIETTTDL